MKIYVASSWRNNIQPLVVEALQKEGHEVYDFKNPKPGDHGFHWSEIDPDWQNWTSGEFRMALNHPIAEAGFESDMIALENCDICVLVLPSGRSAHLEAGFAIGANKSTIILLTEQQEPELMYKMAMAICTSIDEVVKVVRRISQTCRICGCTDDHACEGGCWWVEPGLCSRCAGVDEEDTKLISEMSKRFKKANE